MFVCCELEKVGWWNNWQQFSCDDVVLCAAGAVGVLRGLWCLGSRLVVEMGMCTFVYTYEGTQTHRLHLVCPRLERMRIQSCISGRQKSVLG